jgi:hypothetical protein
MVDFNYTDMTIIMDRSGSMHSIRSDAEGGINSFIKDQSGLSGKKVLTVVAFDDKYEIPVSAMTIEANNYPSIILQPRGSTALLDAIGKTVVKTGERFAVMPENQRPGKVLIIVVTDGLENASQEFTRTYIKELIQQQENTYNWQFIYLGANQDGFAEGMTMGFKGSSAATYTTDNIGVAFRNVSNYSSDVVRCCNEATYKSHFGSGINFSNQDRADFVQK